MLALIPKGIPPLRLMLEDIGNPTAKKLAKALGVCPRTVFRWKEMDDAPRPVMLALFWITRWGQSAVNCQAHNEAVMYAGYVNSLKGRVAELEAQVEKLGQLGDFGSANDAAPGASGPGPQAPRLDFPSIQFPEENHDQPPENHGSPSHAKTGSTQQPRGFQRG